MWEEIGTEAWLADRMVELDTMGWTHGQNKSERSPKRDETEKQGEAAENKENDERPGKGRRGKVDGKGEQQREKEENDSRT